MSKPNHKHTILKKLYDTELHLTATDFNASNANQYLGELESQELVVRYEVKREGMSPFKLAYVSGDQKEKVEKYLGITPKVLSQDEVQESQN